MDENQPSKKENQTKKIKFFFDVVLEERKRETAYIPPGQDMSWKVSSC